MHLSAYKEAEEIARFRPKMDSPIENDGFSVMMMQNENQFDSLDDLYKQIELCWYIYDEDPLYSYLIQLNNIVDTKDFNMSDSFFYYRIDKVLFNIINDKKHPMQYRCLVFHITLQLFEKFSFSINFIEEFVQSVINILQNWENNYLTYVFKCFVFICSKNADNVYHITKYLDICFILDKLGSMTKISEQCANYIQTFLLTIPPDLDYLNLILYSNNNENKFCPAKRFCIFLWLIINDSRLLDNFSFEQYGDTLYFYIQNDETIVSPCLLFLSIVCKKINGNVDISLVMPYINNFSSHEPKICASALFCLSEFAACGMEQSLFCFNNNIVNIINQNITVDCQNQLKREAVRCICRVVLNLPNTLVATLNFESLFFLFLNVLDYQESDINLLIFRTLKTLFEISKDLVDVVNKNHYSDFWSILSEFSDGENDEIRFLIESITALCRL